MEAANETLRNLSVFVNASAADDGEDNCKPKYFVYNSQVRNRSDRTLEPALDVSLNTDGFPRRRSTLSPS